MVKITIILLMYGIESKVICFADDKNILIQTISKIDNEELTFYRKIDLQNRLDFIQEEDRIVKTQLTFGDEWLAYPPIAVPICTKSKFTCIDEINQVYELTKEFEMNFIVEKYLLKKSELLTDDHIKALKLDLSHEEICYVVLQMQKFKSGIVVGNQRCIISDIIQAEDQHLMDQINNVFK